MILSDTRNVMDEFKGMPEDQIIALLDERGVELEIAIENTIRDFNMGTIVRTANAFGIRTIHVVGRKQWNKRGAMMTYKYMNVVYHTSPEELRDYALAHGRRLIAVDNIKNAVDIEKFKPKSNDIVWFGQEGPGLSEETVKACDAVVMINQRGSTRSLNVGVAAGIILYRWVRSV